MPHNLSLDRITKAFAEMSKRAIEELIQTNMSQVQRAVELQTQARIYGQFADEDFLYETVKTIESDMEEETPNARH